MKKKIFIAFAFLFVSFAFYAKTHKTNTIEVTENNIPVKPNGIVYITEYPKFPQLKATLSLSASNVNWRLAVKFNRINRNTATPLILKHNGSSTWDFTKKIKPSYIGGLVIITGKTDNNTYSFTFNIRAKNPTEKQVLDYIGNTPWYAKAIALHESGYQNGRQLCQFNELGKLGENYVVNIKGTPNRGHDMKGWGIFQITTPAPSNPDLWNWKKNIDTGKKIMGSKIKLSKAYFNAVKRTYPNKYTPPPKYTPPDTHTHLSALEASSIQLYNGGAVVESLLSPYGKYSTYISCWRFHPDNQQRKRWEFVPNRNNYVKKIITTYENM